MARDYYDILGVKRGAADDAIKSAYRKLARQFHPDRNPGDKEAAAKFKEIQTAYEVLGDAEKRKKYDQFGAGFEQMGAGPGGGQGPFQYQWSSTGGPGAAQGMDPEVMQSVFEQIFGGGMGGAAGFDPTARGNKTGRGRGRRGPVPQDVEQEITIDFLLAARGGNFDTVTYEGQPLSVKIPAGVADGQTLRVRGQGVNGGDLLVKVHVRPHAYFRREGDDLILEAPITIPEAVLGAKIDVPTLEGTVTVRVPPGTSSGARLRLREKGFPRSGGRGDQLVEIKIVVPRDPPKAAQELIEKFGKLVAHHPRADQGWHV